MCKLSFTLVQCHSQHLFIVKARQRTIFAVQSLESLRLVAFDVVIGDP